MKRRGVSRSVAARTRDLSAGHGVCERH